MFLIDQIAEARIREAAERGEFEGLPGAGKSLELDDDRLVPEELRVGYRLLKNAGYLPPELELRREIQGMEELLASIADSAEAARVERRLHYLTLCLNAARRDVIDLRTEAQYYERLRGRWER